MALNRLIEKESTQFQKAVTKFDKTCIVLRIAQDFEESGGRFLRRKRKSKQWMAASHLTIMDAISGRC